MPPLPTGGMDQPAGWAIMSIWATGSPFEAIGLPDNGGRPWPALGAFGFDDGTRFLRAIGGPMGGGA